MKALKDFGTKIDTMSLRERAFILVGLVTAAYFLFDLFVYLPMQSEQKNLQTRISQNNATLASLTQQIGKLSNQDVRNQVVAQKDTVQQLRTELAALDTEFNRSTANLVMPGQMARLLQEVLSETDGVRLRRVTSLGSMPLVLGTNKTRPGDNDSTNNSATGTTVESAFRHGLQIEFEGSYFSTLDYVRNLEGLEWKFFWDSIDYNVTEYPDAIGTLSLYTISLDENWIGI